MRLRNVLIISLCILLLFSGCRTHNHIFDLVACGSYGVPGMWCYDLKGQSFQCEILETDPQGRVLYMYTTHSEITGQQETALVICQSSTSRRICFYEDVCYYFGEAEGSEFLAFKQRNDWEAPLDESKMATRYHNVTFDLMLLADFDLNYAEFQKACAQSVSVDTNQLRNLCCLDENPNNGNYLFWMETETDGEVSKYFLIISPDYTVTVLEAQGTLSDLEHLAAWKTQAGWKHE